MKLRPTIFLSGVSSEFRSFRDDVEIEIQKKGCFAENQSSFPPDYRTVEAMLRSRLQEANAVVHIVGFRFGAEPKDHPSDKPRRSYTQMEFDIAREMDKPVYVFLTANESVRDAANPGEQPEDPEVTALQLAHRQAVQNSNHLYYVFQSKFELSKLAAEIPQVVTFDFRADISRIVKYAPSDLIGRENELQLLNDAWLKVRRGESQRPNILTFVALGGEGKTSLIAKWLADLAYKNWPGCDSAFAWSFYSQGTREQVAASSDLFLKEALNFFGDERDREFAASAAGGYEKGQRLGRIVSQRRSLLILDGLEPLQYTPTSPTGSELKDSGIAALLKGLAADNDGLCIVTTRYSVPDLKAFWQTTAPEVKLLRLSNEAGVDLLKTLGVKGTGKELETLVQDVKGHALTLNLLGTYLRDAHDGDIRRRDLIKLEEADAEEQGGHAFRVMEEYEHALEREGDTGERALALLRLLGLFDRPMTAEYIGALLQEPAIAGLTERLVQMNQAQRSFVFKRLEDAKLITINREDSGALSSVDGHPLLREYFARRLRSKHADSWREGHRRLCEYLFENTSDKEDATLEDLQPLYHAVAHGCFAGLQQATFENIYFARILRYQQFYSSRRLGAIGSNLGAVACFFDVPWGRVSPLLKEGKAHVLNEAAYYLRALGRLNESLESMRAALEEVVSQSNWMNAAIMAGNLSELELTLGDLAAAMRDAERSVTYADRSGDKFQAFSKRTTEADAMLQAGRYDDAEKRLREAETMQQAATEQPMLYSLWGYRYCDWLLALPEREAWRQSLEPGKRNKQPTHFEALREATVRGEFGLSLVFRGAGTLLDTGLNYLTLCRSALFTAVLSQTGIEDPQLRKAIDDAVNSLRRSGQQQFLPFGILARGWLRSLTGSLTGPDSAQQDLNEAWEIAERGPMRLHMADIHLCRARLFFRNEKYPWESPRKDLEEAERLIKRHGYHRRDEELADAKRVILDQV